jgi:hypothetical protein
MGLPPFLRPRTRALTARGPPATIAPMPRLVLVLIPCLLGCHPQMALPGDLANGAETFTAADRSAWSGSLANEGFKIGPYAIADVDRKATTSSSLGIATFKAGSVATGYSYKFRTPLGEASGSCASEAAAKSLEVIGVTASRRAGRLGCRCDGAGAQGQLVLDAANSDDYKGEATTRGPRFAVMSINQYANGVGSGTPVGFEARGDAGAAAVELLRPGRLWLARPLDGRARADLSCLLAGLMLYQAPRQE